MKFLLLLPILVSAYAPSSARSEDGLSLDLLLRYFENKYSVPIQERFRKNLIFMNTRLIPTGLHTYDVTSPDDDDSDLKVVAIYMDNDFRAVLSRAEQAFVLCHEIGHAVGKGPTKPMVKDQELQAVAREKVDRFILSETAPVYVEGAADHFAASCMKEFLIDRSSLLSEDREVSSDVEFACKTAAKDASLCKAVLEIGRSALFKLYQLEDPLGVSLPSYSATSRKRVRETETEYPSLQCRIDSLKAGYFNLPFSRCWHKP